MTRTVFEKGGWIGRASLLGVIYRLIRKGHAGTAPAELKGDPRRSVGGPRPRTLVLLLVVSALASLAVAASASADTQTFTNSTQINLPEHDPPAPYPSQITVSGMGGPITDVNVTIHRVGHNHPVHIGLLLVSPSGDSVKLMYGNCGEDDIEDFTWIFDQQAANPMPRDGTSCPGFVYRPNPSSPDLWHAPAPPGPHGVSLSDFNGENPNGTWSLYVIDTHAQGDGDIEGGWTLTLTTGPYDVEIPGSGTSGPADPYPATRTFSTSPDRVISDLNVTIDGIWHQRPDDLDVLLVGPGGQKVILMSDACGTHEVAAYGWGWDDEAPAPMPDSDAIACGGSRFHRPADHEPGDSWPAPAPPGPHATALSAFDGTDPNGEWKLFVQDDSSDGVGFFTDRFQLEITTVPRPDTTAPTVEGFAPTGKNVSPQANVRATFSEAMVETTVEAPGTFTLKKKGTTTTVPATVTYDPTTRKVTLDPTNKLRSGATYIAKVTTAAKDLAGNALDQDPNTTGEQPKSWSFTVK